MENSSRALFIAASVILGVLLLSVMIYVFRQGSRVSEAYDQKQITNQLELYNARFEVFDRSDNNIIDIISLANLAYSTNAASEFDDSVSVNINVIIGGKTFKIPNKKLSKRNLILDNSDNEISIYNLADCTLEELGITNLTFIDGNDENVAKKEDKLSTSKLVDGKRVYKYLFKVQEPTPSNPTPFAYHEHNLKVSSISLKVYISEPSLWK